MTGRSNASGHSPSNWMAAVGCLAALVGLGACATLPTPSVSSTTPVVFSYETKLSWVLRLEERRILRDPEPPVVAAPLEPGGRGGVRVSPSASPDLVALLSDDDARLRRRAALAAGRVGLAEAVPALVAVLAGDAEPEVRQMAAFALGLIGDTSAVAPLSASLADPSPLVRGRAAEALGLVGGTASADEVGAMVRGYLTAGAVARLGPDDLTYPLEPEAEAVRLGLYALARLKAYDALSRAVLQEDGRPRAYWWPIAYAFQRAQDPRAVPALRLMADTETTYLRAFAVRGLGELGDRDAARLIVPLLSDAASNPAVGVEAIRAVGRLAVSSASPVLLDLAFSGTVSAALRVEALQALAQTAVADDGQEGLFDLLSDKSAAVRAAVLPVLARLDAERFIAVLAGLEPDAHWTVRAALAKVLGTLPGDLAVPRLRAMVDDEDSRVVPAVLGALTKVRAPDAERVLLASLERDDAVVRMAAARGLGELKPPGGVGALAAAFRVGQRDTTYLARAAALTALAKYDAPAAVETLELALGDSDWAVRVRAAELLAARAKTSEAIHRIRPAPGGPAAGTFGEPQLTAPTVSPHVYVETDKGTIVLEMAVVDAPLTTATFMALANKGFYDGVTFHRVVPNFVVQSGDPRGDGEGGPGFTIRDELNQRPYLRGAVGMALDWRDTGGSQFFITHSPHPHLDARYTAFGSVVSGMDVVDRIEQGDVIRRLTVWDGGQGAAAIQTPSK